VKYAKSVFALRHVAAILTLSASVGVRDVAAQSAQTIYDNALENGWVDWSWATVTASTTVVHGGTKSLKVTAGAWEAIYLHHDPQNGSNFGPLTFWLNGGSNGGQLLQVQATLNGAPNPPVILPVLAANTWTSFSLTPDQLGTTGQSTFDGFWIQDRSGNPSPSFFFADAGLTAGSSRTATNTPIQVLVDAKADVHPISKYVYGAAFASQAQAAEMNLPINRSGGNSTTRYNWQLNAYNHAADYYFESIAESSSTPAADIDSFVSDSTSAGAVAMVTTPMIGWAPKLGPNRAKLASYSIAKYGPQTGSDASYFPDAGNGISAANKTPITWNDPNDANTPVDVTFEKGMVQHLVSKWGGAAGGGPAWYLMDNEVSLWHSTHQDVHPKGATMVEIRDKVLQYAAMVKSVDPAARVAAPEEWGWPGYFYSGADQQAAAANGWSSFPDRAAHGNEDYLAWLLDQWRADETMNGRRLVDALTVHYYPQEGEDGSDVSTTMQLRRNRSTRSLWDQNYTDTSWIADKVMLGPRLKALVASHYPGLEIGLTEYSWGAESSPNGATAQADVLGILGREGFDIATRWTTPPTGSPAYNAFKMYRNYDGKKSAFGDQNVRATVPNPDNLAAFAATRSSDGALTIMLVNKQLTGVQPADVSIANFSAGATAHVWQLAATGVIQDAGTNAVAGGALHLNLPPQSVTLVVVPTTATPPPTLAILAKPAELTLRLSGSPGTYRIDSATGLVGWMPWSTNIIAPAAASVDQALTPSGRVRFFRAVAQ
jgi:Glycoside hydrolase family 44